ncbi:MAG: glycoside hydrolase family 16 protein [Actinomycetales bacterium]|nr:MAG: glycoside hydrolase family 16 protein [Actinomycetales bacterium]
MTKLLRWTTFLGAAFALVLSVALVVVPEDVVRKAVAGSGPVWKDEFSGKSGTAPSPKRWNQETGGKGWGNGELQCYTQKRSNSALDGKGHLKIVARKVKGGHACDGGTTNAWTSARLSTKGLYTPTYGRVEMRAKVPKGKGTWPAFWALGADPDVGWPEAGEFDVLEHIGRIPKMLHFTIHGADQNGEHAALTRKKNLTKPVADAWHTYGVTWTKTSFTYTLDGKRVTTITKAEMTKAGISWAFDSPFYFILNLSIGGTWPGAVDPGLTSATLLVDWVRVYG